MTRLTKKGIRTFPIMFLILPLTGFLCGCSFLFGPKAESPEDYIFSSYDTRYALQESLKYGSVNEAIAGLHEHLKTKPADIKSRLILSRLYLLKNRKQQSESQARQVERFQFKNIKAKIIRANIYYMKGFNDQTKLILEPMLRHPDLTRGERNEVLNLLAGVALREGQDSESINYLKWSLKTDPKHLASHMNLGLIYVKNQEYRIAENHFRTILKASSSNFAARLNLGVCLASQKKYSEAENLYEDLYSDQPENHLLIYNFAVLRYRQRQYPEAISLLKDYVDAAPSKYIAKRNAIEIIDEIQLSQVRVRGLSNEDIQELTERLKEGQESGSDQQLSFDANSEIDAGFVFTNVGFIPD